MPCDSGLQENGIIKMLIDLLFKACHSSITVMSKALYLYRTTYSFKAALVTNRKIMIQKPCFPLSAKSEPASVSGPVAFPLSLSGPTASVGSVTQKK